MPCAGPQISLVIICHSLSLYNIPPSQTKAKQIRRLYVLIKEGYLCRASNAVTCKSSDV